MLFSFLLLSCFDSLSFLLCLFGWLAGWFVGVPPFLGATTSDTPQCGGCGGVSLALGDFTIKVMMAFVLLAPYRALIKAIPDRYLKATLA